MYPEREFLKKYFKSKKINNPFYNPPRFLLKKFTKKKVRENFPYPQTI